jgi:signal transduction histidine kinase
VTWVILAVALIIVAVLAMLLRIYVEQAARQRAETRAMQFQQKVDELEAALQQAASREREWLGVLAHEMRSPMGAILGYAELLRDGALGDIDERGADASLRMAKAAEQVLALIQGIETIALIPGIDPAPVESVSVLQLLEQAAGFARFDAETRQSAVRVESADFPVRTRRDDAALALLLAVGAAIKVSPARTLVLSATQHGDGTARITITGTALRTDVDDPATASGSDGLTGAGFRIALARSVIAPAGGGIDLLSRDGATDLLLRLPSL